MQWKRQKERDRQEGQKTKIQGVGEAERKEGYIEEKQWRVTE